MVTSVNAAAAARGLAPGMPLAEAQALHPGLEVAEADPQADAQALRALAAWCLRLSPLAAPSPPDGIWIDVTGAAHLAGGEAPLLARLTARLAQAGTTARAALAGTPGCAHALARYGQANAIVPPGGEPAALRPLTVAALRLDPGTVAALRRLGFETIGALLDAPRAPLARRFGAAPLRRLDQALGRAPEPIEPILPPSLCRARLGFPEPIATAEDLARATARLAERLCDKLRARGLGATRLELIFQRTDGSAAIQRIGTAAPTRDAAHLTRLLQPKIEQIDPGFGIEHATLAASVTTRLSAAQPPSPLAATQAAPDLAPLIDTLANRLGEDRLFRLRPVESDLPERSLARLPPLAPPAGTSWPAPLPRPVRLFEPPRPIEAIALLPDAPPASFTWRRRTHRVRRADGPERIYGEWWTRPEEAQTVRDYFQVEDEDGARFWLFRRGDGEDPATGDLAWFLHGLFA